MIYLADYLPDISQVPSDFQKNWWVMLAFTVVIGLQIYNALRDRSKQQREVSGKVQTEPVVEFADQDDLDELQKTVEVEKFTLAGQVAQVQAEFTKGIHELSKDVTHRMAEIANLAGRHDATLSQIERRITVLENNHAEAVTRLHSRIDDAMRAASARHAKA